MTESRHSANPEKILRTLIELWCDQNNLELQELIITEKEDQDEETM